MGVPLKNVMKSIAPPPKNSIFSDSAPKEILSFYNLPLKNSTIPQPGWGGAGRGGTGMLKPNTRLASAALFTNFRPQDITLLRIVAFTNGAFNIQVFIMNI